MHFHHYTLRALASYFQQNLIGCQVWNCFSQNKNELVIELDDGYIRVGCNTPLTYLIPVDDFAKARKNVVDLFSQIKASTILGSRVVPNERILILELEDEYELIFKMHGTAANVLLSKGGKIEDLFIQHKNKDWEIDLQAGPYHSEHFRADAAINLDEVNRILRSVSPIYDKHFGHKVYYSLGKGMSLEEAVKSIEKEALSNEYYIYREKTRMRFMLFSKEKDEDFAKIIGITPALHLFLRLHFQYDTYRKQYTETHKMLRKPFQKFEKVYQSYLKNIRHLETERNPEELGHILMANLHQVQSRKKQIELDDFYTGKKINIKLDPKLNPQENAERYYKKYKQRKGKLIYLKTQLDDIERKMRLAENELQAFLKLPEPEKLRFSDEGFDQDELKALKQFGKVVKKQQQEIAVKQSPFRTFSKDHYKIFVGRNAKNNDELSFKFAAKDDIWLHAKDVTGSHVIIRQKPGAKPPTSVLEYAAQLAAFYSKRKNDTVVPVIYTPRKYIRKRKGDPPGMVVVDRESVIMVEPVRE